MEFSKFFRVISKDQEIRDTFWRLTIENEIL